MPFCSRCGKEFPEDGFKCCPGCREATRIYVSKNRVKYTRRVTLYRILLKLTIIKALGGKCKSCGYHKNYAAFDLHHIDPKTKESSRDWRNAKILTRLEKYELLCRNCHAEKHYLQAIIGDIDELMARIEKERRETFPDSLILAVPAA
jgi:hypothetical protein